MNELIKISTTKGKQTVNARDLHAFLEVKRHFSIWIKNRIEKFGFIENQDFTINKIVIRKATQFDFYISLDMAKELSMLERNEKGRQARRYFIQCEKKLKEVALLPDFTNPAEAARAWALEFEKNESLRLENKKQNEIIEDQKPKAKAFDALMESRDTVSIGQAAKLISQFDECKKIGQNKLFEFLRKEKILMVQGESRNQPFQEQIDRGRFELLEQEYSRKDSDGKMKIGINLKPVVTQKGLMFIKKLWEERG